MFKRVLIANRGVAAMRIGRTLGRLGIPYVAVFSEADAELPHLLEAETRICLGAAPVRASYLNRDAILAALKDTGADALHPGYGFLSEDGAFARAVEAIGVRFIGPRPEQIEAMGDKVAARRHMSNAGIPMLPASGPLSGGIDPGEMLDGIGLPILVKASAGGGGVGMQVVRVAEDLHAAVERTRRLSDRAFGDGTVYLERYLDRPRHIEFQLVGDGAGSVLSLFERDCTVQRRHQKIVEESPAPRFPSERREGMAKRLEHALGGWGYASLGTVEMLMDDEGGLYFLEMNTRLQVEHGVTEAVTGLDLVELQVRLAAGEALAALMTRPPRPDGHAIEVRVYAEDPVRFLPSPGRLDVFRLPSGSGIRVDTGYREGNTVTSHYDPMLALVIARADDRDTAIDRLDAALADFAVSGVRTNIPFLRRMLNSEAFRGVRHDTTFAGRLARAAA